MVKKDKVKPYILNVAEIIYLAIFDIKKSNPKLTNIEAIELFIGSEKYNKISSGKFHDDWFKELEQNQFIDPKTKKKIPEETFKLLLIHFLPVNIGPKAVPIFFRPFLCLLHLPTCLSSHLFYEVDQ